MIPLPPPRIRLATVRDVRRELAKLYCDARGGRVAPGDAAKLAFVLDRVRQCLADVELEQRVIFLEERHGKRA